MVAKEHPPIQVVDDNDQPTGGGSMQDVHQKGLKHRVAVVLVEDQNGRVLLQKRSNEVSTYQNSWDVSAAGHVDEGEEYKTAAARELAEELGITGYDLEEIDYTYSEDKLEDGRQLNRFRKFFKAVVPANTQLKPSPDEITEVRWFTLPELRQFLQGTQSVVYDLEAIYNRYYPLNKP